MERIERVAVSAVALPLSVPVSDAKVLTGRQRPMTEVAVLFATVTDSSGASGFGFGYSKRAGGPGQYAHACELAPVLLGEDPNDIGRLWEKLAWAGASVGRGGLAVQAIAAFDIALWDLKAKRAGLPLAKLLGAYRDSVRCYNTSGGFLHASVDEILDRARESLAEGIGGIKLKVGQPDTATDLARVTAVRDALGDDVPLMVDANQQWDRPTARRMCRAFEPMNLVWVEEPLDAHDVAGHAELSRLFDTPIATGEMLASVAEHAALIDAGVDIVQPDAPRVGGITQFLKVMAMADRAHLHLAPHFAREIHVHLAAAYPREPWVEHFEWFDPLFNEHLEIADGRMHLSTRPGLGVTVSDQARAWTTATHEVTI